MDEMCRLDEIRGRLDAARQMTSEPPAQEIAHRFTPRCSGGTGYGPGGDTTRWHTDRCTKLAAAIHEALEDQKRGLLAYVGHLPECPANGRDGSCTCGLRELVG